MSILLVYFTYFLLLISLINHIWIRIPKNSTPLSHSVAVIVPMRNEADNVAPLIESLQGQIGVSNYHVVIVNDASTDATDELASRYIDGDTRFSLITTAGPEEGWLGKVSALQEGLSVTTADVVITIDADVRLEPKAIARAVNQLSDLNLDFISPYPRQIANTFAERMVQPLLHWSWMTTVILRLAEKFPMRSTAVANGQFFVVKRSALGVIDGFSTVRTSILDDIDLARSLISAGFRGVVTQGSSISHTRMYSSFSEIRQGYGKSLSYAFGGKVGAALAIAFIAATGIAPLALALTGDTNGWIALFFIFITRFISALRSRANISTALLHPVSSAILIYLIIYSFRYRGRIQWKGRTL